MLKASFLSQPRSFRSQAMDSDEGRKSRGRCRVVIRVRPSNEADDMAAIALGQNPSLCTTVNDDNTTITVGGDVYESRKFAFDRVLDERATQVETYQETAAGVIQEVLRGFNGAVLAYGQTGTGKTHTMFGNLQYKDRREPLAQKYLNHEAASRSSSLLSPIRCVSTTYTPVQARTALPISNTVARSASTLFAVRGPYQPYKPPARIQQLRPIAVGRALRD